MSGKKGQPNGQAGKKGVECRPKYTRTERERIKAIVAQLDRDGYTQPMIAAALEKKGLGVSQQMVGNYLKSIREGYVKQQVTNIAEKLETKRHQLRDVIRRALRAYKWTMGEAVNSLSEKVMKRVSTLNKLNLPIPETMTLSFGFVPQSDFLRVVMDALKLECAIDGLTKEQQTTLINQVSLDWNAMVEEVSRDQPNEVDAKIAALEGLSPQTPQVGMKELPPQHTNGQHV